MAEATSGHVPAYGYDPYTARADELFRELLGDECDIHYVFNGTGANIVSLASVTRPYDAVICPSGAHINVDECGAPERVAGLKLVPVETPDGKLTPDLVKPHLTGFGFEHHSQPRVISISQVSELGTVYSPAEVRALADLAHEHGMYLHMDGARIGNAVASLGVPAREVIVEAGVDVLSFGGTKNGMALGEAVIHFGDARRDDMLYTRKQLAQLSSKMRFISAQFAVMLEDDLWLKNARHANAMATRLAEKVGALGIKVTQSVDANEVFAVLDPEVTTAAQERYAFYVWDESTGEVRWVTSWDTTEADVDGFAALLGDLVG
jgi:threonine aldolase